jgi:hypothetical protein
MPTSHSRNETRAREYYRLWGCLPLDMTVMLVEDGYIIEDLERSWDEEFWGENV